MILEVAVLNIREGRELEFEQAFRHASAIIASMKAPVTSMSKKTRAFIDSTFLNAQTCEFRKVLSSRPETMICEFRMQARSVGWSRRNEHDCAASNDYAVALML